MDPQQQFCLKWNSFGSNLVTTFDSLFKSESLTDVTLFCEGVTFKAHKLILAACSKHFQDLFEAAPHCPSVLVILDGTSSSNMSALLEFMYKGEVHVSHESLSSFLKAAECLQVKGLSIEHEKLAAAAGNPSDPPQSPQAGSGGKKGGGNNTSGAASSEELPPSTSSSVYTPYMPYVGGYYGDPPRKRERLVRASVLRDGSKGDSPLYTSPPHFSPPPYSRHNDDYDRTAAVETPPPAAQPPPDLWRSPSCPEDLSVKVEPPGSGGTTGGGTAGVKSEWSNYGGSTPSGEGEEGGGGGGIPPPPWQGSKVSSGQQQQPPSTQHKMTPATTPDGKKLQCPFCERLYGYETNLRAHIRQRHQGIRVPCPFCSRTFTRNNTVRRHIAREHKTELSLKAFQPQPSQVQNHNQ